MSTWLSSGGGPSSSSSSAAVVAVVGRPSGDNPTDAPPSLRPELCVKLPDSSDSRSSGVAAERFDDSLITATTRRGQTEGSGRVEMRAALREGGGEGGADVAIGVERIGTATRAGRV